MNLITGKNFLMKLMSLNSMKTNQDFRNEESARQYSLLKSAINKPLGKLIKEIRNETKAIINTTSNYSTQCLCEV